MLLTKRKPFTVGEILREEFMKPRGQNEPSLAAAMGIPPEELESLCAGRRPLTESESHHLARIFGNSPEFWQNTQRRTDQWRPA